MYDVFEHLYWTVISSAILVFFLSFSGFAHAVFAIKRRQLSSTHISRLASIINTSSLLFMTIFLTLSLLSIAIESMYTIPLSIALLIPLKVIYNRYVFSLHNIQSPSNVVRTMILIDSLFISASATVAYFIIG